MSIFGSEFNGSEFGDLEEKIKASTYRRYACRCEACTGAASEAQRKTRAGHTGGSGA